MYFCFLLPARSLHFYCCPRIQLQGIHRNASSSRVECLFRTVLPTRDLAPGQSVPSVMAVRLRLAIHGIRNNRIFHLVAIDQRKRRNAKPIELLGIYRPKVEPESPQKSVEWSVDRIKYWLGVGAQPSDSVVKLLTKVRSVHASLASYGVLKLRFWLGKQGKVIPPDSKWHCKPTLQVQHQQNAPPPPPPSQP